MRGHRRGWSLVLLRRDAVSVTAILHIQIQKPTCVGSAYRHAAESGYRFLGAGDLPQCLDFTCVRVVRVVCGVAKRRDS